MLFVRKVNNKLEHTNHTYLTVYCFYLSFSLNATILKGKPLSKIVKSLLRHSRHDGAFSS